MRQPEDHLVKELAILIEEWENELSELARLTNQTEELARVYEAQHAKTWQCICAYRTALINSGQRLPDRE